MEIGLMGLLRAVWTAAMPIVLASLPSSRLASFHAAILGFSRRGMIMQTSTKDKFTVAKRFFAHFYVLAVVWTTLLLVTTWMYAYRMAPSDSEPFSCSDIASYLAGGSSIFSLHRSHLIPSKHRYKVWLSVLLVLLMEVQVLRRPFETIYVFNYSPSARMHSFAYFTGFFFHTTVPAPEVLKFVGNELTAFIIKGKSTMLATEFDWWDFVNPLLKLGPCQWVGAAIFPRGWMQQRRCHAILASTIVS